MSLSRIVLPMLCALAVLAFAPGAGAQDKTPAIPFLQDWMASPHANVKSESFTHWDKDGAVPERCAKCHSGPGFLDFIGADGSAVGKIDKPAPIRSVIDCVTCHQGRESTPSVNRATQGIGDDTVSKKLKFINVHYRAAAATLWGAGAKGGYEYPGKTYHGRFLHTPAKQTCIQCHDPHKLSVRAETCTTCHAGKPFKQIRTSRTDYDGDGDISEGIAGEIETLHQALGKAIADYAKAVSGQAIIYDSHHHPYFFTDKNANGRVDAGEATRANAYKSWTPRLVRAAYNYQFILKDPGAYAHNPPYALQLLYDSLESLSVKVKIDMGKLKRP